MASLYTIPAVAQESINGRTPQRSPSLDIEAYPEITFVLDNFVAFTIEAYDYPRSAGQGGGRLTNYQLVAYGAGPGWGPDLTKAKDADTTSTVYPTTETNHVGATEGKYVFWANVGSGDDRSNYDAFLDFIANELEGIRND